VGVAVGARVVGEAVGDLEGVPVAFVGDHVSPGLEGEGLVGDAVGDEVGRTLTLRPLTGAPPMDFVFPSLKDFSKADMLVEGASNLITTDPGSTTRFFSLVPLGRPSDLTRSASTALILPGV
jgi:hypothetical protein